MLTPLWALFSQSQYWPTDQCDQQNNEKGMGCGFQVLITEKLLLTLWMVSVGKPSSPVGRFTWWKTEASHQSQHQLGSHTSGHTEAGRPVLIKTSDECSPCWYPECDLTKDPELKPTSLIWFLTHRTMWDDMCSLLLSATKLQDNLLLSNR